MLTLVMPYYDNPDMLRLHYEQWATWNDDLISEVAFVIVDDGSPNSPALNVVRPRWLPISIYRVLEDRPWHQHAARNLGAHVAEDGWLLMTDMDHMLERGPAEGIVDRIDRLRLNPGHAYMLHRIEASTREPTRHPQTGNPKPHPNSFLLTKKLYWKIGGYDEDYCGIYGTDALFRKRLSEQLDYLEVPLVRYHREIVPDASTRTLARKEDTTRKTRRKRVDALKLKDPTIKTLAFPWRLECSPS